MVESLKDDIAELKEAQFQAKVHEKEIQLIAEVRFREHGAVLVAHSSYPSLAVCGCS